MKKNGIFFQISLITAAVGIVAAVMMGSVLSGPLVRILTDIEKRPMRTLSGGIFGVASDALQNLLDNRKENDAVEVEIAKQDVLARIERYRASIEVDYYRFAVVDDNGRILAGSLDALDPESVPPFSGRHGKEEFAFRDGKGETVIASHRYFPAWKWHLFTLVREEDLMRETTRIKAAILGSGLFVLLSLLFLFFLLLRNIVQKPLSMMVRHARGMTEGNFEPIPETGGKEVRELSRAFNRMGEAIRQRGKALVEQADFADSNPNMAMKVAADGSILYANRSVERKLHELGLPIQHFEILLPDDVEEVVADLLAGENKPRKLIWKVHGRSIEYTIFRLAREDAAGFYGVDVTQKKTLEMLPVDARKTEAMPGNGPGEA